MPFNDNLKRIIELYDVDPFAPLPILLPNSDREKLAGLFNTLGYKVGCEVGVGGGVYAEILCKSIPGLKFYGVDLWRVYPGIVDFTDDAYLEKDMEAAMGRLKDYDAELIREYSVDAVKRFEDGSLDFVYIDANHWNPWVTQDIEIWSPKVRSGGIVSGHDYHHEHRDVVNAVDGYALMHNIKPYFIVGNERENNYPALIKSWFWVQP